MAAFVELQQTVTEDMQKPGAGLIRHTRTLSFPGTGEELQLRIERMTFTDYDDVALEIEVETQ